MKSTRNSKSKHLFSDCSHHLCIFSRSCSTHAFLDFSLINCKNKAIIPIAQNFGMAYIKRSELNDDNKKPSLENLEQINLNICKMNIIEVCMLYVSRDD